MKENLNKNRNTFNLVCYIKKAKTLKNGEAPVYMRITVNNVSVQNIVNQ